jgi:hypothetical protein
MGAVLYFYNNLLITDGSLSVKHLAGLARLLWQQISLKKPASHPPGRSITGSLGQRIGSISVNRP